MLRSNSAFLLAALLASTAWAQPVTVTFTLESSSSGQTVLPEATIDWTVLANVPTGDCDGLAFVCVDLIQGPANPSFFDLPPADGVPTAMDNFSRPLGVSNPGEGGAATGYVGVQRSPEGQTYVDLIQIGGAQNTFGEALPPEQGAGQSAAVVAGIGQGGTPQVIAFGSFPAPSAAGVYTLQLDGAKVNVLAAGGPPPTGEHWPTLEADVDLSAALFTFEVQTVLRGDMNCDDVLDVNDVPHFVQAMVDPAGYDADHDGDPYLACARYRADMNTDTLKDGDDIQLFADALLSP